MAISIEWPPGSGIFPHHDRSPHDTLNANLHAAETLMLAFKAIEAVCQRRLDIFYQAARRSVLHTLTLQSQTGCFPYRSSGGSTINYTSLVLWCLLNTLDLLRTPMLPAIGQDVNLETPSKPILAFAPQGALQKAFSSGTSFLCDCVDKNGHLLWETNETSTAKFNMWTYAIACNVLRRGFGRPC